MGCNAVFHFDPILFDRDSDLSLTIMPVVVGKGKVPFGDWVAFELASCPDWNGPVQGVGTALQPVISLPIALRTWIMSLRVAGSFVDASLPKA